ncbi:MAG TPA: hypothetical protein VMH83_15570 [Candidatus Acidoferrum sp.]|nr:hypothetical protein [Candidatus Acidoferrum sp.]
MEAADYGMAWVIYGVAGVAFAVISWRLLRKLPRELGYLLECLLLALMFTPCAVIADQPVMAPALIVFILDSFTIEPKAGIRALIPLVLAIALALIVGLLLGVVHRLVQRRAASGQQ